MVEAGTTYCSLCLKVARRQVDAARPSAALRGYGVQWRKVRARVLLEEPLCRKCQQPATVVDHIIPHRGDGGLMWRRDNMQALCTACHNRKTATEGVGYW